jgi:glycosyltransferase involved in cell wall biosynthesis
MIEQAKSRGSEEYTFFTVVIPTRERADTLEYTIRNVLTQDYPSFQVLVSDNASQDETQRVIDGIQDHRLRYINTGSRVSMSKNWEFALTNVSDGWVTVLGDDDGLLPGSLAMVDRIIKETGAQAIRSNGCAYLWPSLLGSCFGQLSLSLGTGFQRRDSNTVLQKVLKGDASYTELPMLYNGGFIDTKLIDQVKTVTGEIFRSMTPDVYSAIVFSHLIDSYIYTHEPLAINGASAHSGGTAAFEKVRRKRNYDPAEKFWAEDNIPFHPDLPLAESGRPVKSITICIYEAYLQAKDFHALRNIKTSHQDQLRIALAKSGPDNVELVQWASEFARLHNLDLAIQEPPKEKNLLLKKVLSVISSRLNNHVLSLAGSETMPLSNVQEAAIVAGAMKAMRPTLGLADALRRLVVRFTPKVT